MRVEDVSSNWTMVGETVLRREMIDAPYGTPLVIGSYTVQIFPAAQPQAAPQSVIVDHSAAVPAAPKPSRPAAPPSRSPAATVSPATMSPATAPARPGAMPVPPTVGSQPIAPQTNGAAARPSADATGQVGAIGADADASAARPELQLRREIHKALLENLDLATLDAAKLDDPSMRPRVLTALRRIVKTLEPRIPAGVDKDALVGELADEALGLGPLERFIADPTISEIMVVDPETIYIEQGGKLRRTDARFTDDERVRAVIERIVTPLGRRIDESSPLVDARLKDGSRVNAIIRPLALRGSCITIRKFAKIPLTLDKIISFGGLTDQMGRFLQRAVLAKKNVVISGGTGSGKTTLLNILSGAIPGDERIVTIEDAAELQLKQPHVVSLETRPANMEGRGEYTIRDLVKNALRMRPDRIVVGECRGGEALDMLQAMNTGHDGSLTTTHANSPREAVARLETLVLMGGLDLPSRAIREQIAGAVHLIVQQSRLSDGTRKVTSITEVVGIDDDGEVELRPIFEFVRTGTGEAGKVVGEFRATGYLPSFLDTFIVMGLVRKGEPFL
ncbi:MAG: Flp pilus assembly complex ATPase component TadA [Deltaproteobacteria bacterium]|nr:Flp pilus assembly complex ATPase component TadA [Deltaproteobacteria bacterium]